MLDEEGGYAAYNALARRALIWGVPVIPLVIISGLMVFSAIVCMAAFGPAKGLILPALLGALLFFLKIKSMDNSRAIDEWFWDVLGALYRLRSGSSVVSFSSSHDDNYRRMKRVAEFIENPVD